MPKVSIIMGTYNRASLIPKAVQSVREQTFSDWELIIADDGSSDDTEIVVKKLQEAEPRIICVKNPHQGISKNYNTAFKVARGEYVAMIDDDDPWLHTDKLKTQIEFLEKNMEYVGCGGGVVVINREGIELYRYLKPKSDSEIRKYILLSNPMANSTTLFRQSSAEKVGYYDETLLYSGDRDFWLKMGLLGKLYNFPIYFSYYTMSGTNTSIAQIRPHLEASLLVMKRFKGKYPHYLMALFFNKVQSLYTLLPEVFRKQFHQRLALLKRRVVK